MSDTFHWCRTVFFLIPTISAYTIVLGSLSVLSSLRPAGSGSFAHGCARLWSWLILATTGVEVEVHGLERLKSKTTYIFVSNHQSIYDIPVIFWSLPCQLRIIAKESLGRIPFLGWHLRRAGHLLVDRQSPDRGRILGQASQLARDGISLIVFPEGTRSRDGQLGRFKAGSFLLALEADLPLVPVTVIGTCSVMRKGQLSVRPGHVRLVVHDPLQPRDEAGHTVTDARQLAEQVREIIGETVAKYGESCGAEL
ncbi:MAG: 1-acyl-sn-glycerol-3-phosphate acyltransferase [Acidobacteria bacterium]|nr:1-acyl-sn-glycerol-3-phosphate acyltransferase [Acidobacteriota bacterium]